MAFTNGLMSESMVFWFGIMLTQEEKVSENKSMK